VYRCGVHLNLEIENPDGIASHDGSSSLAVLVENLRYSSRIELHTQPLCLAFSQRREEWMVGTMAPISSLYRSTNEH
jgi:hypothetical protein